MKFEDVRKLFPIFSNQDTSDVIYFDNASTTLKPISVINKVTEAYSYYPANVYRGAHRLSEKVLFEYEAAREKVKNFINAGSDKEIIFTKGTTEGINLIARSYGEKFISVGDEIVITQMEHHANILPWKMLCNRIGAILKVVPFTPDGVLDLKAYSELLSSKTKMVAVVHVSNSLGTVNPIATIIEQAHAYGAKVLIDAAQSISHFSIDVQELDVDFLCFSGHKMYGPFGVGVLYGKEELLEDMPPFLGGGGMIENVSFDSISFSSLPNKFEPGTPSICGVIGLGEAINFIHEIGFDYIKSRENHLTEYADNKLRSLNGLKIFGNSPERCPLFSFNIEGVHPHDVNTFLSQKDIAIRSGHHCTQPIMNFYKVPATNRVSLSFYNSESEIDFLANTLQQIRSFFI